MATVGDFRQFKTGAQFGSWLGLVPTQNSSGGKVSLGCITKRGDNYLRTLLIQGGKSAVMTAHKRQDRISRWLVQLLARVGWQKAAVAMANKNARILWAVLAKGRRFDPPPHLHQTRWACHGRPDPGRVVKAAKGKAKAPACSRRCITGQTGSR